jgi:hypothetical protein
MKYTHFGNFFEKIKFIVERKSVVEKQFEWSAFNHPDGVSSDCFRTKIYSDKNLTLKLFFYRSQDPIPRYDISQKLRTLLVGLSNDVTEEEILIAVWTYLQNQNLFVDGKDKKLLKLNEVI